MKRSVEIIETTESVLDHTQLADFELLVNGGYAPVGGFMTHTQYDSIVESQVLESGESWSVPIVLGVSVKTAEVVSSNGRLKIVHPEGIPLGLIERASVWSASDVSSEFDHFVSGEVRALADPVHYDFSELRLSPEKYKARYMGIALQSVIGFTSNAPMRPEDFAAVLSAANEESARVLLAPIVPPGSAWDRGQFDLIRAYVALLPRFENVSVDLVLIPAPHVMGDNWGMALRRAVLQNYGCERVLVASDLKAGSSAGDQNDVDQETGDGFPEVAEILRQSNPPPSERGFTVFFTGLPSSGKSTLANYLVGKLMEDGRRSVTLLDGDIVRRQLSSELGFSQRDRDTNIRRIGYVASEITKAGGIAVCAPIAPYDSARREVRSTVSQYGDFIEVYVSTPVEICEQRDRKGLYAKARAGLLKGFTGVDDPYERPMTADLEIDTSEKSPLEAVSEILEQLIFRRLIG